MKDTYVVHLTAARGMQASARIARFLAAEFDTPLLDCEEAINEYFKGKYAYRDATLLFVNGPIAFSKIRDQLANEVFPYVKQLVWVQNDYTIAIPANPSISGESEADTPFRKEFGQIPKVTLWSTCEDVIKRKGGKYTDWNRLTYAPFNTSPPQENAVFYYGALRENRKAAFSRLLNSEHVQLSVSRNAASVRADWLGLCPLICFRESEEMNALPPTNGNKYGQQPLLSQIARFQHSVYIADDKSNSGKHSLANRFYEVLSTPHTVLWLDREGADAYEKFGLKDWELFSVSESDNWDEIMEISDHERLNMAKYQRKVWLPQDPYLQLREQIGL